MPFTYSHALFYPETVRKQGIYLDTTRDDVFPIIVPKDHRLIVILGCSSFRDRTEIAIDVTDPDKLIRIFDQISNGHWSGFHLFFLEERLVDSCRFAYFD